MTNIRKRLCIALSSAVMIAMLLGTFATGTPAMAAGDDQPITLVQSSLGEFTGGVSSFACNDGKINLGMTFHYLDESAELILEFHNSSDKDYYISSVYDTNNNSYLSFRYNATAGVILKANSDTNVPIHLTYSQAVDNIDERSQAFNSNIEFEFTEYVNPDPDPDPDIDPETDPETDPDVDPETDPSTDPETDPDVDPGTGSATETVSKSETAAIPKSGDVQIGYIIAVAVCALLVIAVLLSGRKCGLFALALALLLVMPISAKASGDSQDPDDGSGGETVSCTVNVSGTIQLNDKIAVTYDYGDGRAPEVCTADYLSSVPSPSEETPVRDGYTFAGWYDIAENEPSFFSQVGYDLTFTAKWTANIYRITYTLNGGVLESANPATYKITDSDITLNNPTLSGNYFIGWREDENSDAVTSLTIESGSFGDKTFIAAFTPYLPASIKKYSDNDTKVSYLMSSDNKTYVITQAANSSGLGADGAVCDDSRDTSYDSRITAAWGDTYLLEFTLFLNDDGRFMINPGCTIDGVSGNDGYGDCWITIDNVTYAGDSDRIANGVALKAGAHTIAIRLRNSNFDINLNQDDFVSCTTFGLQTGSSNETYEIRDLKAAVFIE